MFNSSLILTPDFSLPARPTDYQINLALLRLKHSTVEVKPTPSGHLLFSLPDKSMRFEIRYVLPAEDFVRSRENLQALKDETQLNFIWDPLNTPEQTRTLADPTVIMSMDAWSESAINGIWRVLYPGYPLQAATLRENEICLEMRHEGRDLRRAVCEAYLMSRGWRGEVFLYHDRYRDIIRMLTLTRSQYKSLLGLSGDGFLPLHRRLIWFPSLAPYAARRDGAARDKITGKEALCRKENKTRSLILDDELHARLTAPDGVYKGELEEGKMKW